MTDSSPGILSNQQAATPLAAKSKPEIQAVKNNLKPADSPLDFIRQNMKGATIIPPSAEAIPVERPAAAGAPPEATVREPSYADLDLTLSFQDNDVPILDPEEPTGTEPEHTEATTQQEGDDDAEVEPVEGEGDHKGPQQSIRALRRIVRENKDRLQTLQTEHDTVKEELQRYKSGEHVPDKLREQEARIAELEQYERLLAFRKSPEYRSKFGEPIETLKTKARAIAEEYEVDPRVFDQALTINNKKDLHDFLKRHFDEVGVLEARDVITNIRGLATELQQAEAEPKQALERLNVELEAKEALDREERINKLINTTKSGWAAASAELNRVEDFPELQIRSNDEEHNKISQGIVRTASQELGKFVTLLGAYGVKELPVEVMKMLAKRFQLSQAASVIAQSRAQYAKKAEDTATASKRKAPMIRPAIGASPNGMGSMTEQRPKRSLEEAADQLLQNAINKSR